MKFIFPLIFFLLGCSTEHSGAQEGGDFIDASVIDSYELEDLNINSTTFGQTLNHTNFLGKVILYYFPSSDT